MTPNTLRPGASERFHRLPSVDLVLHQPDVAALAGALSRELVIDLVRAELDEARAAIRAGTDGADANEAVTHGTDPHGTATKGAASDAPGTGAIVAGLLRRAAALTRPSLRRVINATGVILHTNLGRAPLSREAVQAMAEAAMGYSNLEMDLENGRRGSRHSHLESLLCRATGAEAALAVNNNAAAVFLVLSELAAGREVIISRGQAVEIGGGFRIPDVLRQSGARLVEVGTTNRTRLEDYAAAIGPDTAALLHVHTSNFRIVGFTESVSVAALAALGRERGAAVVDDAGSGCLLDTTPFGIGGELREPTVQESLGAGVDLVCFSGDKLLGGPQAGIIAGRSALVARIKRHPLVRALRLDKVGIAGLAATLLPYVTGRARQDIPVWRMLGASSGHLADRAAAWRDALLDSGVSASTQAAQSAIGGGSLPGVTLPTTVLAVTPRQGVSVDAAAARLRRSDPAVIARIYEERLLFDPRTVLPEEDAGLLVAIQALNAGH